MHALGQLLPAVVRQSDDNPVAREAAVFAAWSSAAGAGVRRTCVPVRYDGTVLMVSAADQTWKTQLEKLASQYIFKINALLGAPMVRRIAFKVDPAAVAAASAPPFEPVYARDPAACARELAPDAEVIDDPELRDLFLRVAGRCMARRGGEGEPR